MRRPPLLILAGLFLAFQVCVAQAQETWELGASGWNTVEAPDPLTPKGQLQLLRRELIVAGEADATVAAPTKGAPAKTRGKGGGSNRYFEWFGKKIYFVVDAQETRQSRRVAANQPEAAPAFDGGASAQNASAQDVEEKVSLWLKANPRHALEGEARLLRGDARFSRKDYWQALYDYEFVARNFPATPSFQVALERERRMAEIFLNGWKRKFLGMRIIPTREEGVELLVRIQERMPGSALGEDASLRIGDWYFETADMDMAVEAYSIFLQNYPDSHQDAFVLRRIIEASLARFSGPRFDSTGLIEARERIFQFRKKYPVEADQLGCQALLNRISESLALRDFYNAHWYERRREFVSAGVLYRRVLLAHPTTAAATLARGRLQALHQGEVDPRDPVASAVEPAPAAAGGRP